VGVRTDAIGKTYPSATYAVGREKIREFAGAVGESNPVHLDLDAARAAGHADLVAPPMFAVVYSRPALGQVMFDPELAVNYAKLVHGAQAFRWGPLVIAGDEITTTVKIQDISVKEAAGLAFYVIASSSVNQRGEVVCSGTWANIVRDVS
jgi:acyl dehydratase